MPFKRILLIRSSTSHFWEVLLYTQQINAEGIVLWITKRVSICNGPAEGDPTISSIKKVKVIY